MIPANELRIGNWVELRGEFRRIDEKLLYNLQPYYSNPIPLTPEVLEKCDVKQISKIADLLNIVTTQPKIEFTKSEEKYTITANLYWRLEFQKTNIKILFFHQLQNLYFALTGEELTVNLQTTSPV